MTDPRPAAGVLQDLHTNAEMFAPLASGKPYLGSPPVVDRLVRAFMNEKARGYERLCRAEIDKETLGQQTLAQCARLQDIFLGRDDGYATGPWHRVDQIGAALLERLEQMGYDVSDPAEAVSDLLWLAGTQVTHTMKRIIEARGTPADVSRELETLADLTRDMLLGLPVETPDW